MDITGSCEFWDSKPFVDAANILTAADEPLRALTLLDQLPGFYRDHMPVEIHELRKRILANLTPPTWYMQEKPSPHFELYGDNVPNVFSQFVTGLLRGQKVWKDVHDANARGEVPNIVDLGPGEFWLPIGMKHLGGQFGYRGIGISAAHDSAARPYLAGVSSDFAKADIFVACEIIEHLHHEQDIRTEFERYAPDASIVHISTPLYSFDGRQCQLDWEAKKGLGHVRTYTPQEFYHVVSRMFPEFKWDMVRSSVMHLRGERA